MPRAIGCSRTPANTLSKQQQRRRAKKIATDWDVAPLCLPIPGLGAPAVKKTFQIIVAPLVVTCANVTMSSAPGAKWQAVAHVAFQGGGGVQGISFVLTSIQGDNEVLAGCTDTAATTDANGDAIFPLVGTGAVGNGTWTIYGSMHIGGRYSGKITTTQP